MSELRVNINNNNNSSNKKNAQPKKKSLFKKKGKSKTKHRDSRKNKRQITEPKVVVVGSGGCGKSAIIIQYISNTFLDDYDPTIEDSYRRSDTIDGEKYLVDILDTAGLDEYSAMRDQYMGTGEAFVIVYAITSRETFNEVSTFWEQIIRVKDAPTVPAVIVGNKADLESERQVSRKEGEDLAKQLGIPFMEISAKNTDHVVEVFRVVVRQLVGNDLVVEEAEEPELLSIPPSTFLTDMMTLINDNLTSDSVIVTANDKILSHRVLLISGSQSLESLFGNDIIDGKHVVHLPNLSSKTFLIIIEFLVTGDISKQSFIDDRESLDQLKSFAAMYDMENLKSKLTEIENKEASLLEMKSLINKIAEQLESIVQSAYPERDITKVCATFRKLFHSILIDLAMLFFKLDHLFLTLDATQQKFLIKFVIQKLQVFMRELQELCINLVGKYGSDKFNELLKIEATDFLIERMNIVVQARVKSFADQFFDRKERTKLSKYVPKKDDTTTNPEEKPLKVKRAVKVYNKHLTKAIKMLVKLEKTGSEFDRMIDEITNEDNIKEKDWGKDIKEINDDEGYDYAISIFEKMKKGKSAFFQETQKEVKFLSDFVSNPEFTKLLEIIGAFASLQSDTNEEDEEEELQNLLQLLPTKAFQISPKMNCKEHSDVCFIVEGKPLYCYKPILIARSDRFKVSFTKFKEKDEKEIVIPNHSYDVFYSMIRYFYFDNLDDIKSFDLDTLIDILVCAEEYQVTRLKSMCEICIADKVKSDNIIDLLQTADMYSAIQLKNYIMHHIESIITSDLIPQISPRLYELKQANPNLYESVQIKLKL